MIRGVPLQACTFPTIASFLTPLVRKQEQVGTVDGTRDSDKRGAANEQRISKSMIYEPKKLGGSLEELRPLGGDHPEIPQPRRKGVSRDWGKVGERDRESMCPIARGGARMGSNG